ncbi:MAG TPA: LytR family transcriptional regulator, partial [Desulfosporosinus sp.]|nr:LytR family transcriptional regulator [Desulfosporosinus sp.]
MEWTRMRENKSYGRTILRVLTAYKKAMLLGLLLGISLVLGAVLVSQAVGKEEKPIFNAIEHEIGKPIREQAQKQTNASVDDPKKRSDDSAVEPDYHEPHHAPVSNFKGGRFTVLLVGVDRRPGDTTLS